MKRVVALGRATGSFLGALFVRRDPVVGKTEQGYPLLGSWSHSPEQSVAKQLAALKAAPLPLAKAALFCYEGPHRGEVLQLRRDVETLGASLRCSVVVTPAVADRSLVYQFSFGRGLRLVAGPGASFRLNGTETRDSDLYDYDRLDLLDNRFVVLDLAGVQQ